MKRPFLVSFSILALSILACQKATVEEIRKFTQTPTATDVFTVTASITPPPVVILATGTPSPFPENPFVETVVLAERLIVRSSPGGEPTRYWLERNASIEVSCEGEWCLVKDPPGYIWRGCLAWNPENLGCEAR